MAENRTPRIVVGRALGPLVAGALLVALASPSVWAQTAAPGPSAPPTLPKLPDPRSEGFSPIVIGPERVNELRPFLVAGYRGALKSNELAFDAAASLAYDLPASLRELRAGESWEAPGQDSRAISAQTLAQPGLLFPATEIEGETDKRVAAKRALYNMQSRYWSQGAIVTEFEYALLEKNRFRRKVGGDLARLYPAALGASGIQIQLFRERIRYTSPAYLDGFAWLTFRIFGSEDDFLWVYSPALKKVRPLTGSNRTDPVMSSSMSLDDFFVWSGKSDLVDSVIDKSVTAFAPFVSLEKSSLEQAGDGCVKIVDTSSPAWNYEAKRFVDKAGWIPTGAIHVPRRLWKIDLTSRDPYSIYGRQTIYLDTELMLPAYKIVFDRAGHHMKTIVGVNGVAESADGGRALPYLGYMVVIDPRYRNYYLFEHRNMTVCPTMPPGIQLTDFDPSKLAPQPEATATAAASATSAAEATSSAEATVNGEATASAELTSAPQPTPAATVEATGPVGEPPTLEATATPTPKPTRARPKRAPAPPAEPAPMLP